MLWQPDSPTIKNANLTHYMRWLAEHKGVQVSTYPELWRWSVENLEDFWSSLWEYFDLKYSGDLATPLVERTMPGARTRRTIPTFSAGHTTCRCSLHRGSTQQSHSAPQRRPSGLHRNSRLVTELPPRCSADGRELSTWCSGGCCATVSTPFV